MGKLVAKEVSKRYWLEREQRDFLALEKVNLVVHEREFVCIVGPVDAARRHF